MFEDNLILLTNSLKGKTVKVETVAFGTAHSTSDEGVVEEVILAERGLNFIMLDTGTLVNCRYIRRIEIVE